MAKRADLKALRNMIAEADTILSTTQPQGRAERAHELLSTAVKLADHLLTEKPAAVLGAKGGKKTAERGPEYFAKIAAMRKTRAGGQKLSRGEAIASPATGPCSGVRA
jgi:hypothetical protein